MAKKKLLRFAEVDTFPNVFQHKQIAPELPDFKLKGRWNKDYFKNDHPIVVELGCGKGEYSVGLAKKFNSKNFIGIDLKGNRIWLGAKEALDEKITNVGFVRTPIEQIDKIFAENEISELWITFPDPQPQEKREKKRLTSPRFISMYQSILKQDGKIHLKTDNEPFYNYTLQQIKINNFRLLEATNNLYASQHLKYSEELESLLGIKTYYEKKFTALGFNICYAKFCVHS